ncbi:MAG: COX15/CtaA family protein [Hyphomonadaceae bacterium]
MASEAKPDRLVAWWLVAICVCVIAMILVGGATRLTDSGLSITEWDLTKGLTPPLSAERWAEEFALYQRTTEYRVQNAGMSLDEFQAIYWWEWGHRFLGKMIGLVFAIPFFAFWAMGRLRGRFWPVLGLGLLGGLQGAIGWWMVVSGLQGRLDVSSIRLAVHLGMAFLILAIALRLALSAFGWPRERGALGAPSWIAWAFLVVLFAQILMGALTAGADAGAAYDDWPTIGGAWIPAFDLPFTEDRAALQFVHRTLGYAVLAFALTIMFFGMRRGSGVARRAAHWVGALALVQAGLGIATVVTGSHLALSLIHQAGAVALWIAAGLLPASIAPRTAA